MIWIPRISTVSSADYNALLSFLPQRVRYTMMAATNRSSTGLTISQLSERTGVSAATLRMWETRHGFPLPARLAGGHRRYSDDDVELVRAVIARRGEGLSLVAAIERTLSTRTATPASIFAGLAERRPDLQPMTLSKPALLALSRAIEDEHCAGAGTGIVIGSFQTARFYRQSARRWRELARTARVAVALADFQRLRRPARAPVEVPVGREHPLAREWAIVARAPRSAATLAAWEIPAPGGVADSERRFEVLWSPESEVADTAIAIAAELIEPLAPDVAAVLATAPWDPAAPASPELRTAVRQAHRMLAYLGA
jgi:MerR family transcriptional regulator, light-induced transcriptional regulator